MLRALLLVLFFSRAASRKTVRKVTRVVVDQNGPVVGSSMGDTATTATTTTTTTTTTTPTPVPTPNADNCRPPVYWNLCDNIMQVHSNLGGVGPNKTGREEFRIPKIATVNGTTVDLVVTVPDGQYQSFRASNGKNGGGAYVSKTEDQPYNMHQKKTDMWGRGNLPCWIVIPWLTRTSTKFRWQFVREGTSDTVMVYSILLGIMDFNHQNAGDMEIVEFNTHPVWSMHGSKVNKRTATRFESKEQDTLDDSPTRKMHTPCRQPEKYGCMTTNQEKRTVAAEFVHRGEMEMTWTAVGGEKDRAFHIIGMICSDPPCCTISGINTGTSGSGSGSGSYHGSGSGSYNGSGSGSYNGSSSGSYRRRRRWGSGSGSYWGSGSGSYRGSGSGYRRRRRWGSGSGSGSGCTNTDNGVGDIAGDDCDWYAQNGHSKYCGTYDHSHFKARRMCCACGGGVGSGPGHPTTTTTTHTPCHRPVSWNLCDNIMQVHSNLAGVGPNKTGREEFRIPKIATVSGTMVDLVVTVPDGQYQSFRASDGTNGGGAYVSKTEDQPYNRHQKKTNMWGQGNLPCWIVIPWLTNTSTKFRWQFVREGTSETVMVDSFILGIMDFNHQNAGDVEIVDFNTLPSLSVGGSKVNKRTATRFESKKQGTPDDSPTRTTRAHCKYSESEPYNCVTADQQERMAVAEFLHRGEMEMTWTAVGGEKDRAFHIIGMICSTPPCCTLSGLSTSHATPAPTSGRQSLLQAQFSSIAAKFPFPDDTEINKDGIDHAIPTSGGQSLWQNSQVVPVARSSSIKEIFPFPDDTEINEDDTDHATPTVGGKSWLQNSQVVPVARPSSIEGMFPFPDVTEINEDDKDHAASPMVRRHA